MRGSSESAKLPILLSFLLKVVFVIVCYHAVGTKARTSDDLKVTLPHGGVLVGRHLFSHSGRGIRAFLGIPYAEPPVGDLRFKPPVPAAPWTGERQAVQDSPICIQRDPFRRDHTIEGSEDCLYLNVYTPQKQDVLGPLSVMVWFHGGGWECGAGISAFYGPKYLLDHDVVFVSGNFRLGPLGFLSTETSDCPGNFGLKDQVMVLKWVQENIAAFGGDPSSVTIFGESAGGASATYHMISPATRGLFHKAIIQSGTYFNPWAQPAHKGVPAKRANKVGELLGCNTKPNDWKNLLKCLHGKSAENITATVYDFFEWDTDPMIPFPPVVEPPSSSAFLSVHPRNVDIPHSISIPIIVGITSDEGALKSAPLLNLGIGDEFREKFKDVLPIILYYDHHPEEIRDEITKKINEFYFNEKHDWSKENHQDLTNLFTDAWFWHGVEEYLMKRLSAPRKAQAGSTYVYLFNHKAPASFTELFKGGFEDYYGVCHAEELQYLFPLAEQLFVTAQPTRRDAMLREAMVQMWVNFARIGNPTPEDSGLPTWKPALGHPITYARIGSKDPDNWVVLQNEHGLLEERANFWKEINAHLPAAETSTRDEL